MANTTPLREFYMGKIVAFYVQPDALEHLREKPGVKRVAGLVIGVKESEPIAGIPDVILTVKGRTGKIMTVSALRHYVFVRSSWKEADEDCIPLSQR